MKVPNLILLRKEIARDEGVRYQAYQDTMGLWTIGYGHLLGPTKRMTEITYSEAEALFDGDIKIAEQLVRKLVPNYIGWDDRGVNLSRSRALVNMAFNLGPRLGGFKKFLGAINNNDWPQAAIEMMDSEWAVEVGDRAKRLHDQVLLDD